MTVHRGSWIELIPLLIAAVFVAWLAVTQLDALGLAPTVAAHGMPRDAVALRALYADVHGAIAAEPLRGALAFVAVYTLLQTFSVPGSVALSVLGGALFGAPMGTLLVAFASATGATGAYWISRCVLGGVLERRAAESLARARSLVGAQLGAAQLAALVALRITPLLPNWLINVAGAHVGVPPATFWLGSLLGVAPPTFFFARSGELLERLRTPTDALDWRALATLFVLGAIAFTPALPPVQRRLTEMLESAGQRRRPHSD